jgi:predicted SnoaL-like aldol condensation-catalyzing enzyme
LRQRVVLCESFTFLPRESRFVSLIRTALTLLGTATLLGGSVLAWQAFSGPTACTLTGGRGIVAMPESSPANRELVVGFYKDVLLDHHVDHAPTYLRPDYIQHNPNVGQGLEGFMAYFNALNERLAAQGATSHGEITLSMADGDLVTLHVTTVIEGAVTASFRSFDTFRVADGKIAEHWDVIQPCDLRSALLMAVSG